MTTAHEIQATLDSAAPYFERLRQRHNLMVLRQFGIWTRATLALDAMRCFCAAMRRHYCHVRNWEDCQ